MSDKDTLIQLERTNRARLEQLIQLIIDTIYIPQNELELLDLAAETDFSDDENLKKCLSIANRLLAACHVVFPDSLEQSMNAISETKSDLNRFRQSFGKRVSKFLSSLIVKTISSENVGPFVEMELPNHGEVFTRLLRYSELCKWLSIADFEATVQLSKVYKMCMAPKYDKEITKFVESAKNAASREYNAKRHHSGSTFSIDGIFGKQVIGRGRSESITLSSKSMDPFMSLPRSKHLRKAASIIMDRVLDQIVSHLSEQLRFFIGFFDSSDDPISNRSTFIDDFQESIRAKIEIISSPPAVSSSSSDQRPVTTTSSLAGSTETQSIEKSLKSGDLGSSGGKTDDQSTMLLRTLMASLYSSLGNELQSLLLFLINMDHFNCLYLFVHISNQSRRTSPTENYFTNKLIAGLLINAKRSMDRFTEEICGAIAQFKITRNRSVGILPFVSFLKDFIEEAEEAFEGSTRRIDLDRVYAKIVAAIFSKIRSASKIDNVAVPDEIICIENFHQLQHIIRSSKVASLEGERKSAEELYLRYKEHFVNKYFGKPFKGMYIFFDKIEQKVVAGIKPSDIQFQSELSVAHLKKLIRDNPWSEVTKGLDLLHRQLETQISNNSSLSQVIWRDIQELLLLQYTHYGKLMRKCYPDSNVRLNFTEQDIVQYFSSSSNFRDQSDGVAEL